MFCHIYFSDHLTDLACVDPKDCSYTYYLCTMDSNCADIAEVYLEECQILLNGSYVAGTYTTCPQSCSDALKDYVEYVFNITTNVPLDEVCNCNGNDGCLNVTATYDNLNCLGSDTSTSTPGGDGASAANTIKTILSVIMIGFFKVFFM